jgi:hypothetical protein
MTTKQITLEQVNKSYGTLCEKIGDAQYKIRQHQDLLNKLYLEADKLNELAAMLISKPDQAAQATKDSNELTNE